MTISTRLGLAFAAVIAMLVLVVAMSLRSLDADHGQFTDFVAGIKARADLARSVREAVDSRAIAARNLVLLDDAAAVAAEHQVVVAAHERVRSSLGELQRRVAETPGLPDEVRSLVAEMAQVESRYAPVALAIVELARSGQREEAIKRMNAECRPLLAALVDATNRYASMTQARSQQMLQDADAEHQNQRRLLLAAGLLALLIAGGAWWRVSRSITRPLAEAVRLADSVAGGDLTVQVQAQGRDEVARLLQALGRMTSNLDAIVRQVRAGSQQIATGIAEVASGNTDLSRRTDEQAGALQQTAASMEQLNATVKLNAEHANQADRLAIDASGVATQAGQVVDEVVTTMKDINASSLRIADIIGVIDGIAFQTNILALNAAVEAARAGEQGRGFAVVAGEVRALAQRSAEAAREIKSLINASVERVAQGQALVDRAGSTMGEVVGAIGRVTTIVGEISNASREQSGGVGQIGVAITQMDRTTQQNAALVEESAAAAEQLSRQTRTLVEAVARFRVSGAA